MINIEKTEAMCFSTHGDIKLDIMANNNKLKQVGEKRLLGVTFDPELNFKAHMEVTIAKVKGMIAKLGALTQGLKGANPDFMISIYKSCLRPHLEFGYTIWCTNKDIKELLNVQNLALRRCTGTMYGTPSNSLEVIARVVPLDIRLENSLLCTFLRISRNNKLPLKNKIITLLNDSHFMDYRVLTSLHMFRTASKQVDLNNVEPVIHMSMEHLTTSNPHAVNIEDFKNFGSSSNRTDSQKEAALLKTLDYLASTRNDIIAFTDGSALGNPGPCGAGTAIYWNGLSDQPSHHLHPISQKSSSYHGELYAILLTLEATVNKYPPIYNRKLHIITDCQSAVLATINCDVSGNYGCILDRIKLLLNELTQRKVDLQIFWTAGHINLAGNDLADSLAKEAATLATTIVDSAPLSLSEAKTIIKKHCLRKWQQRWDRAETGRFTYNLYQNVRTSGFKFTGNRAAAIKLIRLKTGCTLLNDYMNRILPQFYTTPNCSCELSRATIEHFLFECKLHNAHRTLLFDSIELIFIKNNVPAYNRFINMQVLLGHPSHLPQSVVAQLQAPVVNFILATGADI